MKSLCFPRVAPCFVLALLSAVSLSATPDFGLELPKTAVRERVSVHRPLERNSKVSAAILPGQGCIQHIWVTLRRPAPGLMIGRKTIIRIYFDGSATPNVEAPVADFFGVMHGQDAYDINTELLSVKAFSGYNCYFPMPFSKGARIEFENGPEDNSLYLQVDWQRYPENDLKETRRFCARWRREMPADRYGHGFLMLDADGPGTLVGFVYGVRLIDDTDRWSHGGSENIYIDGMGRYPAYVRGIGGEDTFGTSYGGVLHPPETHLYASLPYYVSEDTGAPRSAQRIVGYRFFVPDPITFNESIHMRFGSMSNDICATVYWYQNGAPREFARLPGWAQLLPGTELSAEATAVPLPSAGEWFVGSAQENHNGEALAAALADKAPANSSEPTRLTSMHGFLDLGFVLRPHQKGVAVHYVDKAATATTWIDAPQAMTATVRLAWDDHLVFRANQDAPVDAGDHQGFSEQEFPVQLQKGSNQIAVTLSNTDNTNYGGWAFSFRAVSPQGEVLAPHLPEKR